ncbi:MAG: hypothetical protein MGU50_19355 [Trichodesmium sp. MAG_R02]|jgi:hypothetical protein|nr:hypothetical protein [Trichodesmium sp. MAG_R02]
MVMASDSPEAKQHRNPVVLEFSGADSDDIYDLRRGQGRIFRSVEAQITKLQEKGKISENIQPIIVITKKKRKKKGLLD